MKDSTEILSFSPLQPTFPFAMIKRNFDTSQLVLDLLPVAEKKAELSYTGERVSSDGGLLLLREVADQTGLIQQISSCIHDKRDPRYIDHNLQEMLTQRVLQICAGYEDGNDCNDLREDHILKMCAGRLPQSGDALASQPTMSRLENSISRPDLFRIALQLVDSFIQSYTQAPEIIILDCDDTNNDTYGQQQLSLFNNYYNEHCYMPLHIYEGLTGKLITTILKPGRRSKQTDVANILKRLILELRKQWPDTIIIVRGDSHFCAHEFMDWCENKPNTGFITGLPGNKKLKELASVTIKSAEREFAQTQKQVKRYHSFKYKAGSWSNYQKVVVKVEVSHMGTNVRYIVTNLVEFRTRDLYERGYCARGAMELRIKEHKLYLKSDRSSCSRFEANQFRLFLHSMAYVLMHTFQKEMLKGTEFVNASFKTIQNKIIKTAAFVKEQKTKIKIEMPRFCPTKEVQENCFLRFGVLRQ